MINSLIKRFFQFIPLFLTGLQIIFVLVSPMLCGALYPSVNDLSIEEKIGQLLIVHFHGQASNADSERLIHEAHIGGFIYYQWANGLYDPLQVRNLSESLQQSAQKQTNAIPLFIAIDQEGGVVNRLKKGFTIFPGNYALGQTHQPAWAEECAYAIGQELKAVGINMNLAPVVDVNSNPFNPVIGIRAFSSQPEEVALFGAKTLTGYKRAGIIATLKHFPGHGDVKTDSHESLPLLLKNLLDLQETELHPFYQLKDQAPAIMTAHLFIPKIDPHCCVTFSPVIIEGILRKKMNYDGVILTDSLVMQGLLDQCPSIEEAALKSFLAGHDLLLLGGKQLLSHQIGLELNTDDILKIHHFLVTAVRQGRLSEERLNQSVKRILALKQTYQLSEEKTNEKHLNLLVEKNRLLAQKFASRAIQLINGQTTFPLQIQGKSLMLVSPAILREELEQTDWQMLGNQVRVFYFEDLNPSEKQMEELLQKEPADWCIFLSYNCWKYTNQIQLFNRLQAQGSQMIALVVRDPADAPFLKHSSATLCTFSPTFSALQAAKDFLIGELKHE